ncbi:MAG: MBL fold metallo-hydrolase [Gemmatimonadales bacterium]
MAGWRPMRRREPRRSGGGAVQCILAAFALSAAAAALPAQDPPALTLARPRAFSITTEQTLYPTRQLALGVYAVLGDSGQGVEGRPNAGFVDTPEGVVVVGGIASPAQGRAVIRTIRRFSPRPLHYLVLYAHHPDMMFGAVEFKRVGASIIAHPDKRVVAGEAGPDQMVADWDGVVGLQELLGFEYADTPDRPVTGTDTLRLGGRRIVVIHPGKAHSPGDLMLWLPKERVLFTGDILVEDGVSMVVDGKSEVLLQTLDLIDSLHPRVVVPGHGRIAPDPTALTRMTRAYLTALRDSMQTAVQGGTSMRKALEYLPPPDPTRAVSLNSRQRRNGARVYREMERAALGVEDEE